MKLNNKLLFLALPMLALTACSGASAKGEDASADLSGEGEWFGGHTDVDGYVPGGDYDYAGEAVGGGEATPGEGEEEKNEEEEQVKVPAGQLTCSALDDNAHYPFWKSLMTSTQEGKGPFQQYYEDFEFKTKNRLELTINNGNNVSVQIKNDANSTLVDNFHKAYLFPKEELEEYSVTISYIDKNNAEQSVEKIVKDGDTIDLENEFTLSNNLQIMFVIDATGSMGDEITYLKAEIDDVIERVSKKNEQAHIELAIMIYRDDGDRVPYQYSNFTTDIAKQQAFLQKQYADGGGDFEEAVQMAMTKAMEQQWSNNATKLLFHVADAPSHDKDVKVWNNKVLEAACKGIKIIPVASSGIDKKTEYFFRSEAIITGGQYVYLTNHSGIGGDHLEATVEEELVVEYLNSCLVRLIDGYFTGEMANPISYVQDQQ